MRNFLTAALVLALIVGLPMLAPALEAAPEAWFGVAPPRRLTADDHRAYAMAVEAARAQLPEGERASAVFPELGNERIFVGQPASRLRYSVDSWVRLGGVEYAWFAVMKRADPSSDFHVHKAVIDYVGHADPRRHTNMR